jgi:hypothetical protein
VSAESRKNPLFWVSFLELSLLFSFYKFSCFSLWVLGLERLKEGGKKRKRKRKRKEKERRRSSDQ